MSFARLFTLAAIVSAVAALPGNVPSNGNGNNGNNNSGGNCNSGPVQCCNSVQSAHSVQQAHDNGILGSLTGGGILNGALTNLLAGGALGGLNIPVGLTCNPIDVLGIGGNSCTGQTVCCSNNSFNGVVALGCTPVNVNL